MNDTYSYYIINFFFLFCSATVYVPVIPLSNRILENCREKHKNFYMYRVELAAYLHTTRLHFPHILFYDSILIGDSFNRLITPFVLLLSNIKKKKIVSACIIFNFPKRPDTFILIGQVSTCTYLHTYTYITLDVSST